MSDFQVLLFVGQPQTQSVEAIVRAFDDEPLLTSLHSPSLGKDTAEVLECVDQVYPDLIYVFADALEAAGEDVLDFCRRLRASGIKYRPVLIVQSAEPEEKRIQYLIHGADDILSTDVSLEEFKIRVLAHLRRNLEGMANEITMLPGLSLSAKVVQRRLNREEPVALLVAELNHFDVYSEIYGELPARQVLKTVAAVLGRLVVMPDFVSQTDENHFIVATQPDKAEKLASLICRQFETVSPNLYSEKDRKQGYMVSVVADNVSRRVPLISLGIGIASTQSQPVDSFTALFNAAQQMKELAKMSLGCHWLSDRLRLSGSASAPMERKPGVLVLETDAALAYLLKTTLEMEGYEVDVASGVDDARAVLAEKHDVRAPDLLILDALINGDASGLTLAGEVHARYPGLRIICTSSLHNRQQVLQAGVDLYLPKPFELSSLFSWIHRLLRE